MTMTKVKAKEGEREEMRVILEETKEASQRKKRVSSTTMNTNSNPSTSRNKNDIIQKTCTPNP